MENLYLKLELEEPSKLISEILTGVVRKNNLTHAEWSESEMVEIIRQAIPDFARFVHKNGQKTVYQPGAEAEHWKNLYNELISEVKTKFRGENYHQTALRYIRSAEGAEIREPEIQNRRL